MSDTNYFVLGYSEVFSNKEEAIRFCKENNLPFSRVTTILSKEQTLKIIKTRE